MNNKKLKLTGALIGALSRIVPKKQYVSAIILAAGSGTRMGADKTKQWIELDGLPVFAHTLRQFEACPKIKEIILCVKADERELFANAGAIYGIKKLKAIIVGGSTRAQSALNGFKRISDKCTHVAIHDAARCLITPEMITEVIKGATKYGSAAADSQPSNAPFFSIPSNNAAVSCTCHFPGAGTCPCWSL